MNRIMTFPKNINLYQVVTVIFLVVALLLLQAFGYTQSLLAEAKPLTPEVEHYQVAPEDTNTQGLAGAKEKIQGLADNVVEKLNLNQPIAPSTKKFFHQVEDTVENAIGTGTENYQQPKAGNNK